MTLKAKKGVNGHFFFTENKKNPIGLERNISSSVSVLIFFNNLLLFSNDIEKQNPWKPKGQTTTNRSNKRKAPPAPNAKQSTQRRTRTSRTTKKNTR